MVLGKPSTSSNLVCQFWKLTPRHRPVGLPPALNHRVDGLAHELLHLEEPLLNVAYKKLGEPLLKVKVDEKNTR